MAKNRRRSVLALAALFALFFFSGNAASGSAPSVAVPMVHGTALNGDTVLLPQGLNGKVSVLVAGFSQGARSQVTDWGRRLAGEYRSSPTVLYYELPIISGVPRLLRGWVIGKIRDSTPDRARARIVPVVDHEPEWKQLAGYSEPDQAYIMVVDQKGNVRWHSAGALTDSRFREVQHQIDAALGR